MNNNNITIEVSSNEATDFINLIITLKESIDKDSFKDNADLDMTSIELFDYITEKLNNNKVIDSLLKSFTK